MTHNWCGRIPTAESRNPPEKHRAATNIDLRGPTRSTQRPNMAAEAPRNTMAREKTQPISFKFQSCGTDWVNPISFVSGRLKVEKAYAWPMERCTARAAGGTKKRLKPGSAMVLSRSKNDDIKPCPYLWFVAGRNISVKPRPICSISSDLVTLHVRRTAKRRATWITFGRCPGAA